MNRLDRAVLVGAIALAGLVGTLGAVLFLADGGQPDASPDEAAADPGAVGEGISVHGDWVIEVRNADGSVAERREFENALSGFGANFLTRLLDRTASTGTWGVELSGSPSPCVETGGSSACFVRENPGGLLESLPGTHFTTLTVSTAASPARFVLQGNFDAQADGIVSEVRSVGCFRSPPSLDPTECNNADYFTTATLTPPVSVTAGQQVLVRVEISFA